MLVSKNPLYRKPLICTTMTNSAHAIVKICQILPTMWPKVLTFQWDSG